MNFSVLISVYQGDSPVYLKAALRSIWDEQTLKPNEIVLVSDGPINQEIEDVIDGFAERAPLKRVRLEKNMGLGMALAEGLKHCAFEWVARMDADDLSYPDRFAKQVTFLKDRPEIDVLGTFIDEFSNIPEEIVAVRKVSEQHADILKTFKLRNAMNHVSVLMRKELVHIAGNYQSMIYFEDYYLWARMALKGARFHNLQESLVCVRTGDAMISRRKGITYAQRELEFFRGLRRIGFISWMKYFKALLLRLPLRFLPASLLTYFYKNFIRTNSD